MKNGNFSQGATVEWNQVAGYEGGAATASVDNGELAVKISSGGSLIWHVQLTQNDVKLEKGKTYKITFKVRADQERTFMTKIGQNGGTYTPYLIKDSLKATTAVQTYEFTFKMDADENGARVEFNIGMSTVGIYLDDIGLYEVGSTRVLEDNSKVKRSFGELVTQLNGRILSYRSESGSTNHLTGSLYSMDGVRVATGFKSSGSIDCTGLANGMYTLRVSDGHVSLTRAVILY